MDKEIYFVECEDMDDYEVSDVLYHTKNHEKAMEIMNSFEDNTDSYVIFVGKSYWNEEGILKDDFANAERFERGGKRR